jgi:hypothetical protein
MGKVKINASRASLAPLKENWKIWLAAVLTLLAVSLMLAWISTKFRGFYGWPSFLVMGLFSIGLLAGGWWLIRKERPPRWLAILTVGVACLHLAAGVFWLATLPRLGHNTNAEREGYVMGDAFARDKVAWGLANSSKPLWSAFQGNRKVDQYGGLLFISAAIYRYLGGAYHQPLLVLLLVAAFSALAVPFTWAFTRLAWGQTEAWLAAWIVALYPEAILLGSSQMREAFTMTLAIAALYGLLRYERDRSWSGLACILGPLLLCLPFSPPIAALLFGVLALMALAMRFATPPGLQASRRGSAAQAARRDLSGVFQQPVMWLALAGLFVLVLAGLYLTLRQFAPKGMTNPFEMVGWWLTKSAQLQAYISAHASGWMQKVFNAYPAWVQFPVLLGYGIVQPFLPAALIAGSDAIIWHWIAIWRALGWTVMLAFLIYAPLLASRKREGRGFVLSLCLVVWLVMLVASFRGGGDLWDNPRYRAMFAGAQAALVAWAWMEHRRTADALMRRALLAVGAVLAWFLPWYLRRYTPLVWPVVDLFKTLGMGAITAFLLILWDWARASPVVEIAAPTATVGEPQVEQAP